MSCQPLLAVLTKLMLIKRPLEINPAGPYFAQGSAPRFILEKSKTPRD
jgi:hypothetical protein